MNKTIILFLTAGAFALAGCSSTPTKVSTGAIQGRTFTFVDTGVKPTPVFADNRVPIHSMIQEAITRNLASKGITRTGKGADLTVGYLIIAGNGGTTTSINDYFGYNDAAADLVDKAHDAYGASKNPNSFEAGTLVIDIADSKTFKLLKRGYATRPILRKIPDDARATRIQSVVDEILRDLRVAK